MQIARLLSGFVLLSSLLLQSCQQEPLRITAEEEYIREFYKTFKNVDPDHDWNLAQKSTVTVKTSVPSSIRVLADVKGTRYLFADYKDAQGSTEIPVTLPKGVSDIIVSVNGQNFPSTLGATVDATSAKSRTINEGTKTILKYGRAPQWLFPATYIGKSLEVVPEDEDNLNREGIINDFFFISEANKPVTIYPVYWNTSSSHVLGVYWLNDDGSFPWCANPEELQNEDVKATPSYVNMQDLYYTRSGELEYTPVMYADIEKTADIKWYLATDYMSQSSYPGHNGGDITAGQRKGTFKTDGIQITFNKSGVNFGFYIKVKATDQNNDDVTYIPDPWGAEQEKLVPKRPPLTMDENGFCSDYHHIVFSHTRRNKNFGRVIEVEQNGIKTYLPSSPENNPDDSEPINEDKSFNSEIWKQPWNTATSTLQKYVGASYFHVTNLDGMTRSYFAFEDWRKTADLNDLIFLVDSDVRVIEEGEDPEPEPTPYTWIIAAEDLGGSFDWDFNDLVAQVQLLPVSEDGKEYTEVTVKPLASGGFRPVYLMYTGKTYDIENAIESTEEKNYIVGGEFHSLFGSSHGNPINVSKGQKKQADEIVFYTPKGHTMAKPHDRYDHENPNMGGFWVLSCKENSPLSGVSPNTNIQPIGEIPEGQGINQVRAPEADKGLTSPQILCLEAGWRWPLELKDIRHAYTTFETWVSDKSKTDWVKTFNEEHIIEEY